MKEGSRLLLVEDDAVAAASLRHVFCEEGYAVKVAVPAGDVSKLIPQLIARGARDVLEYRLEKLVP